MGPLICAQEHTRKRKLTRPQNASILLNGNVTQLFHNLVYLVQFALVCVLFLKYIYIIVYVTFSNGFSSFLGTLNNYLIVSFYFTHLIHPCYTEQPIKYKMITINDVMDQVNVYLAYLPMLSYDHYIMYSTSFISRSHYGGGIKQGNQCKGKCAFSPNVFQRCGINYAL